MIEQSMISAYAPASIGNFSVGFDILGAALQPQDGSRLGDVVTAAPADSYALQTTGPYAHVLPADPADNLVTAAYLRYIDTLRQRKLPSRPLALTLQKNLPVASGLGSSAASIVAALVAINQAHEAPLSNAELLMLAGQLEAGVSGSVHYDNVAPSLLGGMQLMTGLEHSPAVALPAPSDWLLVVSFPGTAMSTRAARNVLPESIPLPDAIAFGRNLANFVHHLHQDNGHQAATFVRDVLAEPHRQNLLPGYAEFARQARTAGALAVGISGSGPTVFTICDQPHTAQAVQKLALTTYCACPGADKTAFSVICRLDTTGACL